MKRLFIIMCLLSLNIAVFGQKITTDKLAADGVRHLVSSFKAFSSWYRDNDVAYSLELFYDEKTGTSAYQISIAIASKEAIRIDRYMRFIDKNT